MDAKTDYCQCSTATCKGGDRCAKCHKKLRPLSPRREQAEKQKAQK